MSGLAAQWRRHDAPLAGAGPVFARVTAALAHRAIDGSGQWLSEDGSIALWHGQFWTTPEDEGELQPLAFGDVTLVFDGRIDNRRELCEAFGHTQAEAAAFSDAALALQAFRRWDEAFVTHLEGPFAVVVWDASNRRLLGARDTFGRRTLFYRTDGDLVTIASEPGALLGGDVAGADLDEVFLAHFFALRAAPQGRTMFASVHELPAGHGLCITDGALRLDCHGPQDLAPIRYRNIEDYGERFAELLERAVLRRMRALGPPAVMMSGGLDSTSVAALAATALARATPSRRLSVVSYVFDELSEIDERQWMAPMVARYDLDQTLVVADDAWPLSDFASWRWQASGPDTGPFRPLNERLYAAARAKGHRVLLTGAASDILFVSGSASWLVDLVADGRWTEAVVEMLRHVRRLGPQRCSGANRCGGWRRG
ncbi:MAG: asparagine synthetase B [Ardenticatenia bacterium]|nr:asparagine synthetase B [Ardenticatenia bacterium]